MSPIAFAWRIWRRDRTSRRAALLTAGAVAITTALFVMLSSVPGALQQRADRTGWRVFDPTKLVQPSGDDPRVPLDRAPVLLANASYAVGGHQVQQVNVAQRHPVAPPDGLPVVPRAGEVLVSPAVARMLDGPEASAVRASLPGRIVGTVGATALTGPDERVVVAGRSVAAVRAMDGADPDTVVVGLPALRGHPAEAAPLYVALVWIGLGLLVLLVIALAMQIARLLATRREERSAALQLVGADPSWALRAAVAETTTAAAVGALLGAAIGVPVARFALGRVSFNGTSWFGGDLTPPIAATATAVVGLPLLTALATAAAHRRSGGPLGAIQRHRPRPLRAARLLALPASALLMVWGISTLDGGGSVLPILIALTAVVATTAVVGPLVVLAFGHLIRLLWRHPATLLAARRMIDEPRAVWRVASGPVLAAFVVATMLGATPSAQQATAGNGTAWERQHLRAGVTGADATASVAAVRSALREQGDDRPVRLVRRDARGDWRPVAAGRASADRGDVLAVAVPAGPDRATADRASAALVRELPGAAVAGDRPEPTAASADAVITGAIGTLLLSSLLAALATAVTSIGTVLDRRRTLSALRMTGTAVPVLRRMMQREVALPTTIGVLVAGGGGALFASGLLLVANLDPVSVINLPLIAALAAAVALPVLAVRAASSTIERITAGGPSVE